MQADHQSAASLPLILIQQDMTKPYWGAGGIITAEASARGLIQRADELSLKTTGRFMHMNGEELPW